MDTAKLRERRTQLELMFFDLNTGNGLDQYNPAVPLLATIERIDAILRERDLALKMKARKI